LVIDTTAPTVTLNAVTTPTTDNTPSFSGNASTGSTDSSTVTLNVYAGSTATGSPVRTLSATQFLGSWSATVADVDALADGTYTAQAVQADTAGNSGTSTARTFVVDTVAPT